MLTDEDKKQIKRAVRWFNDQQLPQNTSIGQLRDVANESNVTEVLPLIPQRMAEMLLESLKLQPTLQGVGYWCTVLSGDSSRDEKYPDPRLLCSPTWCQDERKEIIAYLRDGRAYTQWRGVSWCRFRCGNSSMGSRCLTDGEWVWPEGLAHYVEDHDVRLPDELIESMRRNHWQIPENVIAQGSEHGLPNMSFWIQWGEASTAHRDER